MWGQLCDPLPGRAPCEGLVFEGAGVVVPLVVVDCVVGVLPLVVVDDVAALASAAAPPPRPAATARVTNRGLIRFRKPLPPFAVGDCARTMARDCRSDVGER